jgi:hypothetical protein
MTAPVCRDCGAEGFRLTGGRCDGCYEARFRTADEQFDREWAEVVAALPCDLCGCREDDHNSHPLGGACTSCGECP